MPGCCHDTPRPPLDLTQVTESTRRALYDAVVAIHFSPSEEEIEEARADPENHWIPEYGPDEAGLTVFHAFGRWFTVWRVREEPDDAPVEQRWSVLRIVPNPGGPFGLSFPGV
jgi:hypothetical protein